MADLVFYTGRHCGLCDRLKVLIGETLTAAGRDDVRLCEIDISTDAGLMEQYRFRIPVVMYGGRVILEGRPELDAIRAALDGVE